MKKEVASNNIAENISVVLYQEDIKDSPDFGKSGFSVTTDKDSDTVTFKQITSSQIDKVDTYVTKLPIGLVKMLNKEHANLPVVDQDFYYTLGFAHSCGSDSQVLETLDKSASKLEFLTPGYCIFYAVRTPVNVILYIYTKQYLLTTIRLSEEVLSEIIKDID